MSMRKQMWVSVDAKMRAQRDEDVLISQLLASLELELLQSNGCGSQCSNLLSTSQLIPVVDCPSYSIG